MATQGLTEADISVDLCYVQNEGREPVRLKYAKRRYEFPPGESKLAPRAAVNKWFGDPDLADHPSDPRLKSRTDARRKLGVRWGIFKGQQDVDPETGQSRFPTHLKVYDFDGNLLPTVHIDPEGRTLAPPDPAAETQADLARRVERMQKALSQLQAQAAEQGVDLNSSVAEAPPERPSGPPSDVPEEAGAVPDSSSSPKRPGVSHPPIKPRTVGGKGGGTVQP